ncbi:MAG: hypothetical protein KDJ16_01075, partial [Hyphomicrobiales bacterium]|nr:hypothetical protein [Hyphomicrobiales bacterium]
IGYPVIVKPNIGGSGSGVARFDTREELARAVDDGSIDLGVDGTGLVQEYVRSDGHVYRIEILGGALFYAIRQKIVENQFNYCAADGCSVNLGGAAPASEFDFCVVDAPKGIERLDVPEAILAHAIDICRAAGADVGGVEYFLREGTGAPCFYDFNPYSNFVTDGEALLGFSPERRFVDFIMGRLDRPNAAESEPAVAQIHAT